MSKYNNLNKVNIVDFNSFSQLDAFDEKFWVERLASLQPITIPYAKQTKFRLSPERFARITMPITEEVIFCLKKQNLDGNLGDLIGAAFVGYLARLGGTNSFDLGFRDFKLSQELGGITGLASFVPCRFTINLEQGFPEFLTTVQEQIELTRKHQTYAQDLVIRNSVLEKIFAQNPSDVFPIAIERVNEINQIAEAQSLPVNEITLRISDDDRECVWVYSTEAFEEESIARMLEQFSIFLQGIAQDSTKPLAYLPLLSEAEKQQILVEWNDTKIDYPKEQCIHQLFERQVAKTPKAIALIFGEQQLTYQELNQRANALAHYLQELGVKPETLVGICLERSVEMVIAMLATLKAGVAYIPLDPSYPIERIAYKLEDAQVKVLLTNPQSQRVNLAELLPKFSQQKTQIITFEQFTGKIASENQQENQNNLVTPVTPNNLAYVIYTSGSTGKPKGVEIPHRALVNFAQAAVQEYEITQSDRIVQFASIGFDASIEEIYPCLIAGGTLVLRSEEMAYSPSLLLEKSGDYGITILDLPTAFWHLLAAELANNQQLKLPSSIRLVIIGGEAVNPKQVTMWNRLVGTACQLINTYGPTETTVVATTYKIPDQLDNVSSIPIGRPLPNLQTYILNKNLQPVPIGVPGELYIGGAGLARGYLNRPELTAEKFVFNPFAQGQKSVGCLNMDSSAATERWSKLYKTGDLARYLADGQIEYLGRIDNQVKIRGFRIELGEVEAALALHPNVQQTVVMAREDRPGDKRLVAYIIPHPDQVITTKTIRQFIRQKLPDHMIPTAFVFLKTFSLTPNGKIDLRALPAPKSTRASTEAYVAPTNEVERQLIKIWEEVLGIQGIGIGDNFFDLGGQSLLAVRLFTAIAQQFEQKLTLSTIFQAPTIEKLAKVISKEEYLPDSSYLVPIQASGNKAPFFCIHGAQGEVLFLHSLASHLGADQPFYAIRSPGQNGERAPLTSVKDMAQLYLEEIKAVQSQGPYLLGGYSFGGLVAFEMAQQLRQQGKVVALLALFDCYAPGSLKPLPFSQRLLQHLGNALSIGPDYVLKKLKTLKTRSLYRLLKGETAKSNYFQHLTSTQYFYNLMNEFPNYTVEDLELWENLYQANLQASASYLPTVYEGKVTVFRVKSDSTTSFCQPVADCGWSELSNQKIEVFDCEGDHYTFVEEPYVQDLAQQLRGAIMALRAENRK